MTMWQDSSGYIKRLHNIKIELTQTGLLKGIIEMMGYKINTGFLGCILVAIQ